MTGTGIGFDFSQLMTQFAQLDAELKKLTVSGKNFGDNMKNIFASMTKGDFKNFAAQIKQLRGDVVAFGKVKVGLNWDSTSLQNYINDVNRLILVIKQVREGAKGSHELKGSGISIQGLKKELKDAQELLAIVKKVEQQTKRSTYDRNTSYAGATNYSNNAVSIEQNAKAVEYLTAARQKLKTTDADYLTKLEDLNTRIEKHEKVLRRSKQTNKEAAEESRKAAEEMRRANDQMLRTPSQLVGMKGTAKTVNELRLYAEQLRKTMNTLNPKSAEWQKLNGILQQTERQLSRVENKMKGLNGIAGVFKNALSGVGRMIATAFAVERIWQFSKSIVSVTGEFEQMKVALGSMVGNLEKTNRIWEQTMELAKESPFQARELIKYTRQLAAYRIETDKLHKTTKMLADVSAGLGVDMSRLILAYGQVRAAEYLRGTELRQFTEAGVPMLEELAKHFSELEGVAVSTADAFEMISKRQVAFSDVSAVLEKMTSEGGPFYKMQEVMSDTIKGSISNLKDEIDLMMYEIGQDNDGVIKGMLNLLRSLVRNWEYVGATIKTVTVAILSYTVATKAAAATSSLASLRITSFARALAVTRTALRSAATAVKGFISSLGPIGWAVTIISTLITAVLSYRAARRDANKEDEKAAELAEELKAIDKQYAELAQSVEQYREAFDKASDTGNLNEMEVQLTRLVELAKEKYSIVFNIEIEGATEEELKSEFNRVSNTLSEAGIFAQNFQKAFEEKDPYREGGEYSLFIKEAEMLDHWEQKYTSIKKHVEQLLKDDDTKDLFRRYEANEDPLAYMLEYYEARYKLAKQNGMKLESEAMEALNSLQYLDQLRKAYVEEIKKKVGGESDWGDNLSLNLGASLTGLLDREQIDKRATEAWRSAMESVFNVDEIGVHVDDGMDEWEVEFNKFIEKRREKTKAAIKKAGLDDNAELGDSFRIGGSVVNLLNKDNTKTRKELAKYLKEQRDIQKEIIDAVNAGSKAYTDAEKAAAEIKFEQLDAAVTYLDGVVDDDKKKKNAAIKILNNRIDLIKKIHKKYIDEYNTFGDKAKDAVSKAYKKPFEDAFQGTGVEFSGLVIDKDKLTELQNAGNEAGEAFSEAMLAKMAEVAEKGTYIRDITADAIDLLREHEDIRNEAYKDSGGVWTIGMGQTFNWKENRPVQEGDYWTDEEILMYSQDDIAEKRGWLNDVLDLHKDILITQEQYNQLFNATWQGGKGSVSALFQYAKDAEAFQGWLETLDNMPIMKVLLDENGDIKERRQVGLWDIDVDAEIKKFNELESVYDRLALVMNYISVRDAKNKDTTQSMIDRAKGRADAFRGDLTVVKLLQKSAIDVSKIDFTNVEGVVDILKQLMPIAQKEGKEAVLALEEAIAGFEAEIGLKAKKDADKAILDQVQKDFNRYDLTLELKKLNIPPDLAKSLLGLEYLEFDALKSKIIEDFAGGAEEGVDAIKEELNKGLGNIDWKIIEDALGKDQAKEVKNRLEELAKTEDKLTRERMAKYIQYSRDSLGEMAKIRMEQIKKMSEIEEAFKAKDEDTPEVAQMKRDEKSRAMDMAKSEADEALAKMEWENFRKSETFTSLMDDLSGASDDMLKKAIEDLEAFKKQWEDLPVDQMQEVVKLINKAKRAQDSEESPWAEAKRLRGNISADGRTREQAELDSYNAEMENMRLQEELQMITLIQQQRNLKVSDDQIALAIGEKYAHLLKEEANLTQRISDINDKMGENRTKIDKAQGRIQDEKELIKQYNKQKDVLDEIHNQAQSVYDAFKSLYEAVGGDGEDALAIFADMGMQMASTVLQTISLQISLKAVETGAYAAGTALNTAMGVIGWIVMGVQLLASAFSAIAKHNDKKWERIVEEQTAKVEELQKEYEKLEETIDGAWNFQDIQRLNAEMQELTRSMIDAQKAAIAARKQEKDYRNGKEDAVREVAEMEAETAELEKQLDESLKDSLSKVTDSILDDVFDAAKDFTDAWYEAFKETGDGLSGLEENFEEMFMNLAKNQAAGQITGAFVEQWKNALGDYVNEKDTELTVEDAAAWAARVKESFPELNAALEAFLGTISDGLGGKSGSLSELQKGIQGVTEETAQVLESLLNSMRLYVADTNMHIKDQTDYIKKMWKMMDDSVNGMSAFYVQVKNI